MKKIYAMAAALLLTGVLAQAQDLSFGVGYLYSTLAETSGNQQNKDVTSGGYLGASYNIPISGALGVAPGLYYSILTGQGSTSLLMGLATGKVRFTEHALNLPVYLNYGLDLGHVGLIFFAGPTFQLGLSSKYKAEGAIPILNAGAKAVVNSYEDLSMGRFNIFMGGGAGVDLNDTIRITVGFDYGLLNLYTGKANVQSHRYNLKVGVSYLFD